MSVYTDAYQFHQIARGLPVVSTAPTEEPVSLEDVASHCRIDVADEGAFLGSLIKAAREMVETDARLALMSQTLALRLDCFPSWEIELRAHPVVAISSVVYLSTANVSTTMDSSDYRVDIYSKPSILTPAYGETWPATYPVTNAVTITFTAGYTSQTAVPELAKRAIYLLVGDWYRNRERISEVGSSIRDAYDETLRRLRWAGDV